MFSTKILFALPIVLSSLLGADAAFSATTVSGISGCVMKAGGAAGYGGAPQTVWAEVREPSWGEYAEWQEPYTFGKRTFWRTDYYNANGGTNAKYYNTAFWGQIAKSGGLGLFQNTTPGGADSWGMPAGPTDSAGVDGWHYYRGTYYGYIGAGTSTRFNAYGIYRTKMGYVTVPGNNVFETCYSTSNSANGNWVSGSFVTAKEINLAFSSFETEMLKKISEKKLNLSLVSETSRVVESATAGKNIAVSSTGYKGTTAKSSGRSLSSVSEDATTLEQAFKKY